MIKKLFLIPFVITLFSCKEEQKGEELIGKRHYNGTFIIKDTASIPLERYDFYRSKQTHVVEREDNIYLYRENGLNKTIDVFNWKKKSKVETLNFDKIPRFGGSPFLPLSGDTIFIATLSGNIFIAKNDSIISAREPFVEDKEIRYFGVNASKPTRIDNEIFMYVPSNYLQQEPEFQNRPLLASYNLKTENLRLLDISYPESFKESCWSEHQFDVPFTKNSNDQLVFSFQTGPNIYVYDPVKDSTVAEYKKAKSKYVNKIVPYKECDFSDITTYFKYLKSVPRYRSITYDKFKNIYYRIISLPANEEPDGQRNQNIVMPFSIMVLDEDFNIITERKLPAKSYDPRDYFITARGLWISANNEGAENFDEDKLSYTLFSLQEN